MLGSKYIVNLKKDDTNPQYEQNVLYVRYGLGASFALVATVYFVIYQIIQNKKDKREIWVPPKPVPSFPGFPIAAKAQPKDFEATTYSEYETGQIFEVAKSGGLAVGIAIFMSMKFDIHISCLLQAASLPLR